MYNALRVGFVTRWLVDGCAGHGSVSFRLPLLCAIRFLFRCGEWGVIGGRVGHVLARSGDLVVCDVVAVWVVQPSIVARIGVMLGFAILDWGRLVGVYCECWLVWLWDW